MKLLLIIIILLLNPVNAMARVKLVEEVNLLPKFATITAGESLEFYIKVELKESQGRNTLVVKKGEVIEVNVDNAIFKIIRPLWSDNCPEGVFTSTKIGSYNIEVDVGGVKATSSVTVVPKKNPKIEPMLFDEIYKIRDIVTHLGYNGFNNCEIELKDKDKDVLFSMKREGNTFQILIKYLEKE